MLDITFSGAFGAGLLSFLSPCVLPIVPFYIAWLGGLSAQQVTEGAPISRALRARTVILALCFAAGMLSVFVTLGASASALGQALREWMPVLRWIAGGLIVVMGLQFLGVLRLGLLSRQWRAEPGGTRAPSPIGAYGIGLAFAFGWTPCVGPVLAAILFVAAGSETASTGIALLTAYGIGMTLPFVAAAAFVGPAMAALRRLRPWLGRIERGVGAGLVVFGVLIATGGAQRIGFWLFETVEAFQHLG